jgi:hypothetical protein
MGLLDDAADELYDIITLAQAHDKEKVKPRIKNLLQRFAQKIKQL